MKKREKSNFKSTLMEQQLIKQQLEKPGRNKRRKTRR
jgi:hypothetical protein